MPRKRAPAGKCWLSHLLTGTPAGPATAPAEADPAKSHPRAGFGRAVKTLPATPASHSRAPGFKSQLRVQLQLPANACPERQQVTWAGQGIGTGGAEDEPTPKPRAPPNPVTLQADSAGMTTPHPFIFLPFFKKRFIYLLERQTYRASKRDRVRARARE